MYQLEERILFDGAAAADIAAVQHDQQTQDTQAQTAQPQADATQAADTAHAAQAPAPILHTDSAPAVQDTAITADATPVAAAIDPTTAPTAPDANHVNVLVVSESLENADELFQSANSDTIVVKYDPKTMTGAELLHQISDALHGEKADSIGFVTDKAHDGSISIFAGSDTSDKTISTSAQKNFWNGVEGLLAEKGKVNIFASDLASTANGRHLVDSISKITNHQVAASTDVTGDPDAGGDWELEYVSKGTGSVNLIDEYFSHEAIQSFDHRIENPTEVVFINPSVKDVSTILKDIGNNPDIVYLSTDNAFDDIGQYLQDHADVDAIHIITHGSDGKFNLGNDVVDSSFVSSHQAELAAWGKSMASDGDIMIYGCDVAADNAGKDFIHQFATATGTDVAASTNRTGFTGDWNLEYTVGHVQTSSYQINDYSYILRNSMTLSVNTLIDRQIDNPYNIIYDGTGELTLREALLVSVDGDNIVFASKTVPPDILPPGFPIIQLVDTLTINTNVSIDGTIAIIAGGVTTQYSMIFDAGSITGGNSRALYIDTPMVVTNIIDPVTGAITGTTMSGVSLSHINFVNGSTSVTSTEHPNARGNGGNIFISERSYVNMLNVRAESGHAIYGGGIYNEGILNLTSTVTNIVGDDLSISGNIADNSGGGIYNTGTLTYISDGRCTGITNNVATSGHGGGIYNGGSLTIDTDQGGPFFHIDDNVSGANGGGIYSSNGDIVLTSIFLTSNHSGGSGGGLYIFANYDQTSPVWLTDVNAAGNIADQSGGGFYFTNSNSTTIPTVATAATNTLNMEWCNFDNNIATLNGGAVALEDISGNIFIKTQIVLQNVDTQSEFTNNNAALGGAIYINNCVGSITVDFVNISLNHANYGGAIYLKDSTGTVTLSDDEISRNTSTFSGGGIYYDNALSSKFLIETSDISHNTAGLSGGGIFINRGDISIENVTMSFNGTDLTTKGGAIYMDHGSLDINFATIAYNNGIGAAIYIEGDHLDPKNTSNLSVTNSIIFNLLTDLAPGVTADLAVSQIWIPIAAERGTISFSTANNIYSHYYLDLANVNNSLDLTGSNGKAVDNNRLIGYDSTALPGHEGDKSILIESNLWLDRTLRYHANYRTMALGILSANSWAYQGASGTIPATDQRGNTRTTNGWQWVPDALDPNTGTWQPVAKKASIGAFEPIFHVEVTSKGDDSSLEWTADVDAHLYSEALKGGLTLREAVYWIDTRAALDMNNPTYYTDPTASGTNNFNVVALPGGIEQVDYDNRYIGFDATAFSTTAASNTITLTYGAIRVDGDYWGFMESHDPDSYRDVAIAYLIRDPDSSGDLLYHDFTLRAHNDPSRITVDGGAFGRLFSISDPSVVAINNLTLTNGSDGIGGGILNAGGTDATRTTLTNVVIQNCVSLLGYGGGINNTSTGFMNIYDSEIINNVSTYPTWGIYGGGIDNSGNIYIDRSRISGNVAHNTGAWGDQVFGGGIYNSDTGTITMERSEVSGNQVAGTSDSNNPISISGAGIFNFGTFYMANSTVAENTLDATKVGAIQKGQQWSSFGSAVCNYGDFYSYYNTIVNNRTNVQDKIFWDDTAKKTVELEQLAGIYHGAGTLYLANSIVAENAAVYAVAPSHLQRADIYVADDSSALVDTTGVNGQNNIIGAFNLLTDQSTFTYTATVWYYEQTLDAAGKATYTAVTLYIATPIPGTTFTVGFDWSDPSLNNTVGMGNVSAGTPNTPIDMLSIQPIYINWNPATTWGPGEGTVYRFNGATGQFYRSSTGNDADRVYVNGLYILAPGIGYIPVVGGFNVVNTAYTYGPPLSPAINVGYATALPPDVIWTSSAPDYTDKSYGFVPNLNLEYTLSYNGALTQTYRVLDGSVALPQFGGTPAAPALGIVYADPIGVFHNFTTDQRGVDRGAVGTQTNIGGFECLSAVTVSSAFDSSTPRTGFDFINYRPLWDSDTLTLREAILLADDYTDIGFKDGWRINGTKDASLPGGTVQNEIDKTTGNLIITLVSELPVIRSGTIDGSYTWFDADNVLHAGGVAQLQAAANSRIFNVNSAVADWLSTVTIENFTMYGNKLATGTNAVTGNGGGIYSSSNLTLDNVTIENCIVKASAANNDGYGGAIYSGEGSVTLLNSLLQNNSSLMGGAIYIQAWTGTPEYALWIDRSSILNNTAKNSTSTRGDGGGIFLQSGDAYIQYSVVGNNKAVNDGGGIYIATTSDVTLFNSTVANNTAGRHGGGIAFYANNLLTLNFVTVANNQSGWKVNNTSSGHPFPYGGGIFMNSGDMLISNSLIAQNYRDTTPTKTNPGINDDIYVNNIGGANHIDYSVYGTVGGRGAVTPDVNSVHITDWSASGFMGQLDTKLTYNGGPTMTVWVIMANKAGAYDLNIADATATVYNDQTMLETWTNRTTVGAYEKILKEFYYTGGDITRGNDGGSTWISANGVVLSEADGVLSATDAIFVFDDTVNIAAANAQLMYNWTINSPSWAGTYYSWIELRNTASLTIQAAAKPSSSADVMLDGRIVVMDGSTLNLQSANLANLKLWVDYNPGVSDTTVIYSSTIAQTVFTTGIDKLVNMLPNISPINYDNLEIYGKSGSTSLITKTAAGTLNVHGDLTVGDGTDNAKLNITNVTGSSGDLNMDGPHLHDFGQISMAGYLTVNGTSIDGNGSISAAKDLSFTDVSILGVAPNSILTAKSTGGNVYLDGAINLQNTNLSAASGKLVTLGGSSDNFTNLSGYSTLGSSTNTIKLTTASIISTGIENYIISKGLDVSTAPAWADGKVIQVINSGALSGSSLSINIGAQTLALTDSTTNSTPAALSLGIGSMPGGNRLAVDTLSRLEFVTTGVITSAVTTPSSSINGTLALTGKITLMSSSFLTPVQDSATLELGGTVVVKQAVTSMVNGLTLTGNVTVDKTITGPMTIESTGGNLRIGSDVVSGSKYIGNKMDLTLNAAGDLTVGNITVVRNITMNSGTGGTGDIHLVNSITVTGNVEFNTPNPNGVQVHKAYTTAAKTVLAPIKIITGSAGTIGQINNTGFEAYLGDGSELQLTAGSTTLTSQLNTVNLNRSLTLLKGKFSADSITLTGATGNFIATGTQVGVLNDVSLAGGRLDNSLQLTVGGNISMFNGTLNNLAKGNIILTGNLALTGSASFVNSGKFDNAACNITLENGSLTNSKTLNASSIVYSGTGSLTNTSKTPMNISGAVSLAGGNLTNTGTMSITGTLTLTGSGALNNNAGSIKALAVQIGSGNFTNKALFTTTNVAPDTGITFTGAGSLTNSSTLKTNLINLNGGGLNNSGTIDVTTPGELINITGIGGNFVNSGTMLKVNGISFTGAGNLTNSKTLTVAGNIDLAGGSLTNSGTLSVDNFITMTGNGVLTNSGTMTNAATIITLQDAASLTNTKTMTVNAILFYGSGSLNNNAGTLKADDLEFVNGNLNNKGLLTVTTINFSDNGNIVNSGTIAETGISNLILLGGNLTNSGILTIDTIYMVDDQLSNSGTLTVNDTFTLNAVSMSFTGAKSITNVNNMASVVRDSVITQGKLSVNDFYFGTSTDNFLGTQVTFQLYDTASLEIKGTMYNASNEHFFITQGNGKVWIKPGAAGSPVSVYLTDDIANAVTQIDLSASTATASKLVGLGTFDSVTKDGKYNGAAVAHDDIVNRTWTITRTAADTARLTSTFHWTLGEEGAGFSSLANLYTNIGTTWGAGPLVSVQTPTTWTTTNLINSGSYAIGDSLIAMNDSSAGSDLNDLEEQFINAILNGRENAVEQQMVADSQEKLSIDNMFAQMAGRGNLMERNNLFKNEIDLGLEELLAV